MIDKNLSLQAIASMVENQSGSKQCDLLEALIVKASIELRYTLEEIGNENDDLNKSDICNLIKTEETTYKRHMRECGDKSFKNYL